MTHKLDKLSHATSRDGEARMRDEKLNGHVEAEISISQVAARLTRQCLNKPEEIDGKLMQLGKKNEKEWKDAC